MTLPAERQSIPIAQLPGDVESEAGALVAGGEEGLEQIRLGLTGDAGAVVAHLQERSAGLRPGAPDQANAQLCRIAIEMMQRVIAQHIDHLTQLARVHEHQGIRGVDFAAQLGPAELQRLADIGDLLLEPRRQLQWPGLRPLLP